jgi:hypothetical protein
MRAFWAAAAGWALACWRRDTPPATAFPVPTTIAVRAMVPIRPGRPFLTKGRNSMADSSSVGGEAGQRLLDDLVRDPHLGG